jgi:DNA-binding NtrC family response regulator
MTIFTIDSENNIAAHASASEITDQGCEQFTAIDLLITDVIMPDMQGPDLAEEMLALRPELKVLFMSGYADSDVVRIKVLDRNLGFLRKPFAPDGLLETVEIILAMPTACTMDAGFEIPTQAS